METVESLKRRIGSVQDLHSVVRTMKSLAAVNIRQYEKAVESLDEYFRTVELGLQAALHRKPMGAALDGSGRRPRLGAVVFGSDQGMCGQLNEAVYAHAREQAEVLGEGLGPAPVVAVGERVWSLLDAEGVAVEHTFAVPGSVSAIGPLVQDLLLHLEGWTREQGVSHIYLFFTKLVSGSSGEPRTVRLAPIDRQWLEEIGAQGWQGPSLPMHRLEWRSLFSGLVSQYMFVALFRAMCQSLASENASRLAAMQGAEKNIQEQLGELQTRFHQMRQMSITEELLDIVAGFEALKEDEEEDGEHGDQDEDDARERTGRDQARKEQAA
jgi:F-type H+-transporting ATPase subunit gamma